MRAHTLRRLLAAGIIAAAVAWVASASGEEVARITTEPGADPAPTQEDIPYQSRQTDGNALGMTMTNFGFFGNNFVSRSPSMEYPLGSQQEHLVRSGVWVGAINSAGITVVSTGSVSGLAGASSATASEFTPRERIHERSNLITSASWDTSAVSEQDFVSYYTDYPKKGDNLGILGIGVHQKSYLWSYKFAEAFTIVSFTIVNEKNDLLKDPCFGLYAELSSGYKGKYDNWPPTGWFKKKKLEYFPEERMCAEHHYNYDGDLCPSWGAFAILGGFMISAAGDTLASLDDVPVSFNWWSWYTETDDPFTDEKRYQLMMNREIDETDSIAPDQNRFDAVEVVSAGPFPEMAPGAILHVVCAFVGGMDRESLLGNVAWAQQAFDNNYILPSPPQPPVYRIEPARGRISIYWDDLPESEVDPFYKVPDFEGYRVYITRDEGATTDEFDLVRDADIIDGIGYDTGLQSLSYSDSLYKYRLDIDNVKDGFKYWVAITSYDRGMPSEGVESMESGIRATRVLAIPGTPPVEDGQKATVFPNPYRGEAVWDGTRDREKYVWFANLPEKATIRVYSLAGDLVKTIDFDGSTYDAADVQGLRTSSERSVAIPGGICAWDLITDEDQAIATGLYIYSIENRETGSIQRGKFMVIR